MQTIRENFAKVQGSSAKQLFSFGGNERIIQALTEAKIEFLIGGSIAVKFYDNSKIIDDLEIILNNTAHNLKLFGQLLIKMGIDNITTPVCVKCSPLNLPVKIVNYYPDQIAPDHLTDFSAELAKANRARIERCTVYIASPNALLARLTASTEEKDKIDSQRLERYLERFHLETSQIDESEEITV